MSFSIFGRQQRACRPQNKLKYIWYNDTFMKGFQHCQQKQTETLAGQQIFWTPYFREDQCGDLTKQREISNKLRDPAYGAQFHSRTLVFITFCSNVAMFLSDTSEFGWCHSTPRSWCDSTRSSCCLLTAHLLTKPGKLGVQLSFERALADNWTQSNSCPCPPTLLVRRRLCQRQEKDQ